MFKSLQKYCAVFVVWFDWRQGLFSKMFQGRCGRGRNCCTPVSMSRTWTVAAVLCFGLLVSSVVEATPHLEHLSDVDCYNCVVRHDGGERIEAVALSCHSVLFLRVVPIPAVPVASGGDALLNFTRPPPA